MVVLMRSRLFWRRSAAAAGIYASVVLGFFGTVIVAHAFTTRVLGLYAIVIAATGFFQTLLDLTIEEALVKYGFRFQEREDWGRLRRLFGRALQLKLAGGVVAGLCLLALAPAAHALFGDGRLLKPMLIAAALPLVQAPENVGGVALILRGRYDIRAFFLFLSMALRLGAIAIGTRYGLTQTIAAIVVAQVLATAAVLGAGWAAFRRNPRVAAVPIGEERPEITRFVMQSSLATGVVALRSTLSPLLLGVVSSPNQVGYFRVAQAPQQGLRRAVGAGAARAVDGADPSLGARHARVGLRRCAPLLVRRRSGSPGRGPAPAVAGARPGPAVLHVQERRCDRMRFA